MYVSPLVSQNINTPKAYTNRARDEVNKKLNLQGISTNLKHGSSPLKNDLTLIKTNSNDSFDSLISTADSTQKKHKKFFGLTRLKQITSKSSSSSSKSLNEDTAMLDTDEDTYSINSTDALQPLHPVPSIASTTSQYSNNSYASTAPSIQSSNYSANESLFSNQNSLQSRFTNISTYSIPTQQQQQQQPDLTQSTKQAVITLQEALPLQYNDMYAPELLADPALLIDGRPMFTKRALIDWELNDIRSLLIVEQLRPEWNNKLPLIYTPQGFKMIYLPLDADDESIIKILVESDIYKEAKFDQAFRIQTAKYTLYTARSRHAQILKNSGLPVYYNNRFSKPEWRNVIENFTLNLAVEAQCRNDFKKACHDWKKSKRSQATGIPSTSSINTSSSAKNNNSLLRKAILNEATQSSTGSKNVNDYKLTKEEKTQLWTEVQSKVYRRLGLDWTPDSI